MQLARAEPEAPDRSFMKLFHKARNQTPVLQSICSEPDSLAPLSGRTQGPTAMELSPVAEAETNTNVAPGSPPVSHEGF